MLSQLVLGVLAVGIPAVVQGQSFALPFKKVQTFGRTILPSTTHYHRGRPHVGEIDEEGFWFANFTVGASKDLSLLIDTGSCDVYLNPGVYKPSSKSVDEHANFTITFVTTNPDGSGAETIDGPIYEDLVALDSTQLSISQMPLGAVLTPQSPPTFPNDGLVGFSGIYQTALNSSSWFQHLCDKGELKHCRFGIAYQTDLTGVQYFGYVEEKRLGSPLSVGPIAPGYEWSTFVDLAYDDKVILKDQWIITDSGTTIMFGPLDGVKAFFDAAGIQSVLHPNTTAGAPTTLDGYFPCSNPPTFGFNIPSISNATAARSNRFSPVSHTSTIFNVLPSQLVQNSTGDNCTASIHGTDEFPFWLIGQVFFQGKYIDHNHDDETMGFAKLIDL